ncbi:MAG: vitamin K epoxide reductase family protein [Patescibacteria group bacterium]
MEILLRLLIIIVALSGFLAAFYIWRQKRRSEKLICPLNSDCEVVVHSRYSTLFGLPLEWLGFAYYLSVIVSQTLNFFLPVQLAVVQPLILWLTVAAFLFSLYLIYIQIIKLREWCAWCLLSAIFCTIIFLASIAIYS